VSIGVPGTCWSKGTRVPGPFVARKCSIKIDRQIESVLLMACGQQSIQCASIVIIIFHFHVHFRHPSMSIFFLIEHIM
jgi:hypothetical protein